MVRTSKSIGIAKGFRSGLEEQVASQIAAAGLEVKYEETRLEYVTPATRHRYTPDFELPNGIIVETKGRFTADDRKKHLLVKAQNPGRDIRFVFTRSATRISKTSPTTYADWCRKHGFQFADKAVPQAWLKEPMK